MTSRRARRRLCRKHDRQPGGVGIGAARGQWRQKLWCASLLIAFLFGVLASRLVLREHGSPRVSLLIEAAMVAAPATGWLGGIALPLLSAAMGVQNEAVTHGVVAVNVAFVTGDTQRLGEQLVAESVPPRKSADRKPRIILTVLSCYAVGAAIGTLAARWGAVALLAPMALLLGAALLPSSWTGLDSYKEPSGPRPR